MKLHILLCILFLFGIVIADDQFTTLTYLVEYEDQQEEDYIELGLVVTAEGSSLVNVMNEALKIAKQIEQIATEFCQAHTKKKSDCKDIVDMDNSNIKPKYQVVKRQSKFMGFQVEYKLTIKVLAIDHISDLADTILKEKNTKIISFEWKPLDQVNKQEAAVKQGTEQGKELCEEIGMHLGSILSVEQMTEQETEETAVYKFQISCLPGKKVKKVEKQPVKPTKQVKSEPKKEQKKETKKPEQKKQKKVDEKKSEQKKQKKVQDKKPSKPSTEL